MKVALPPGASMLSVEIAGSPAKPVEGKDGTRVPLLRPGFRPDGPYSVSFVYLNAGTPFAKKGDMQMSLPQLDVPVNVLEWELFVPDRYRVDHFNGNVLAADLVTVNGIIAGVPGGVVGGVVGGVAVGVGAGSAGGTGAGVGPGFSPVAGQIVGRVVDQAGAPIPGATVIAEAAGQQQAVVTDRAGNYMLSGLPSGPLVVSGQLSGFTTIRQTVNFDQRPRQVNMTLSVGSAAESVTVTAEAPVINTSTSEVSRTFRADEARINAPQAAKARQETEPSVNVQSLQRRASGVLPVRMEVPRAGTSHRFVKPLVIDEATLVTFRYRRE
jgi:hypothetical protein